MQTQGKGAGGGKEKKKHPKGRVTIGKPHLLLILLEKKEVGEEGGEKKGNRRQLLQKLSSLSDKERVGHGLKRTAAGINERTNVCRGNSDPIPEEKNSGNQDLGKNRPLY